MKEKNINIFFIFCNMKEYASDQSRILVADLS